MGAKPDCLPALPLVSLHAARKGGFVIPERSNVTTKTQKTEETKTEEQTVGTRPLTNVAVTATPTVTETTKTETKVETEDDGA